jgi:flagellar motor protein MotB
MRTSPRALGLATFLALSGTVLTGCANNQYAMRPGGQTALQPPPPIFSQYRDVQSRAAGLDADNQHLHALLAQQQQQNSQMQAALQESQRQVAQLRGDMNGPAGGGAVARRGVSARAASHGGALPVIRIQGADVVQDGDLVRIRLETSQLFSAGRADLRPEVNSTLDRIAQALKSDYSGRRIDIEGHTDSDPIAKSKWKSNHELAVARSVAVFQALKKRGVPESQLFVVGCGPNRPLTADNSKQTKSQNRRVEIVVYPELAGT